MARLGSHFAPGLSAGGLALLAIGAASGTLRGADEPQPYMSANNPWAKHYAPAPSIGQAGKPRVHFRCCREARAAGYAPMRRGQPGYAPHLDRDGDGIACEPYHRR